jgi:hypothetical protein
MGLRDRVRRLAERTEVKRCVECKLLPSEAVPGYIVLRGDEEAKQEYCPLCSRPLYFFIRVVEEA